MELQEVIEQITELNNELQSLLPMAKEQKEALDKKLRLEFNYNSNHIEGNTLTYVETELLLIFDETRGSHPHRDYEEMKASDVALEMVEQLANDNSHPLTESFIKNLNEILLVRPYWKEAITPDGQNTKRKITIGDYKKFPNSVLLANGETFNYASPTETPQLMAALIEWLRLEEQTKQHHIIEIAALLHYKFVRIHPFDDGNGRISRLLMNYILLKSGYPPIIIKTDDKKNYLNALHDADTGNIESFNKYIAKQLIWSLELSIKAAKKENLEEQEDWKKKLSLIRKKLSDKDTISVVKNSAVLRELINDKIIPFSFKLMYGLTEFDGLFLMRRVYNRFNVQTRGEIYESTKYAIEAINKHFTDHIYLELEFEDFTKDPDNSFSITISFDFKFLKHKYEVTLNGAHFNTKLYHQEFSNREFQDTTNLIGQLVISEMENKIKVD